MLQVVREMIISNSIHAVSSAYATTQPQAVRRTQRAEETHAPSAEYVASSEAKSFSEMLQELRAMPDARQEKVATVSQQLQAGTYEACGDDVAAKLLATRF